MSAVVHGGPVFANWGAVRFGGGGGSLYRKPFLLVRLSDGALSTSFHMGRADIHAFSTIERAIAHYNDHRGPRRLSGKPAIVALHRGNYVTVPPLGADRFMEDTKGSEFFGLCVFHFGLPKRRIKELDAEGCDLFEQTLWMSVTSSDEERTKYYSRPDDFAGLVRWYAANRERIDVAGSRNRPSTP